MTRQLSILLSLCLALFLVDAVVSLLDDTLVVMAGVHVLTLIRNMLGSFTALLLLLLYVAMGITPMIPKRQFLPLTLFAPISIAVATSLMIWNMGHMQQIAWTLSLCQVLIGFGVLCWLRGGVRWQWPLVAETQLGSRGFTWTNLIGFALVNVLVIVPVFLVYFAVCAAMAVHHFTDGFLRLHPGGLTVETRKYVGDEGRMVHLIPMSHIGEAGFYHRLAASFPSNSIILMEGVTDERGLLTNKISYERMAKTLGVAEQHEEFVPTQGEMVPADIDVGEFAPETIGMLNLIMHVHARGLTLETLLPLLRFSPSPQFEHQLWEDLLRKRNRHLLAELHRRLPTTGHIIVPWGVAHMPEIAREIENAGFRQTDSEEHHVIRFRSSNRPPPAESGAKQR